MVNVVDFGADPTGVSDSTSEIQTAIGALHGVGDTLYFPPGAYNVSDQLTLLGVNNVFLNGRGATLRLKNAAPSVKSAKQMLLAGNCNGISIEGLTLVDVDRDQQYTGIRVTASTNVRVRDVTVVDVMWTGMGVFDVTPGTSEDVVIESCRAVNCRFGISVNSVNNRIVNCYVSGPGLGTAAGYYDGILVLKGANNTVLAGNQVVGCGAAGIYTQNCKDLVVQGNTVKNCIARGVELDGTGGATVGASIVGNVITDCDDQINLVNTAQVVVSGNRLANNDPSKSVACIAVNVGSSDVLIVGNHMHQANPTRAPIWTHPNATNVVVAHNS